MYNLAFLVLRPRASTGRPWEQDENGEFRPESLFSNGGPSRSLGTEVSHCSLSFV